MFLHWNFDSKCAYHTLAHSRGQLRPARGLNVGGKLVAPSLRVCICQSAIETTLVYKTTFPLTKPTNNHWPILFIKCARVTFVRAALTPGTDICQRVTIIHSHMLQ